MRREADILPPTQDDLVLLGEAMKEIGGKKVLDTHEADDAWRYFPEDGTVRMSRSSLRIKGVDGWRDANEEEQIAFLESLHWKGLVDFPGVKVAGPAAGYEDEEEE